MHLEIVRLAQPLKAPYRLSFGTVGVFETLIVRIVRDDGVSGLGEITPLPGYSDETIASAIEATTVVARDLAAGVRWSAALDKISEGNPMVVSGIATAMETATDFAGIFARPAAARPIPLAALCDGETDAEVAASARRLVAAGFRHFKMKAGLGDVAADIHRVRIASAAAGPGIDISIDANQSLSERDAETLCAAAADLPVRLVEQPFMPDQWHAFARLAASTPTALMLDESIWTEADIRKAAEVGATHVKLKLCKHPGIGETLRLLAIARDLGLGVAFGNGVQGAVGNHIEAYLYEAAGLDTPAELNGVLKVARDPFRGAFEVSGGHMTAGGLQTLDPAGLAPIADAAFTA
jgi:o-succinylbenzoate synthase